MQIKNEDEISPGNYSSRPSKPTLPQNRSMSVPIYGCELSKWVKRSDQPFQLHCIWLINLRCLTNHRSCNRASPRSYQRASIAAAKGLSARAKPSAELLEAVGLTPREHFRVTYLIPSLAMSYLEMTIPDKTKSSRQKYRLTPSEQTFLNTLPTEQP